MECVCPNDIASTVEECTTSLARLEQCLVSCPSECTAEELRGLLCAVLHLSISRLTDAHPAPGAKCAAESLKHVVGDFEQRDAGNQYWGNYNGVADALAEMQAGTGPQSGAQHRESAGKYAGLLRLPTDLEEAKIDGLIQLLNEVKETKAALDSAKPTDGQEAFSLVAWLADGMVQACVPWLGEKACLNIGTCFEAALHRFEELYASGNLRNAVTFTKQVMLNNTADFVRGAERCEAWRETHQSVPRAGRLRELDELQSAHVETEVLTACDELFAPPGQVSTGGGKHERDAGTSRDAHQKRHCSQVNDGARVRAEPRA